MLAMISTLQLSMSMSNRRGTALDVVKALARNPEAAANQSASTSIQALSLSHPFAHPIFSRFLAAGVLFFTNLDIAGNERKR
jgi:hypothetical protein